MKQKSDETQLFVIKRNGKKVDFDESKIALAIKKGFDSVNEQDEETGKYKYSASDIGKVHTEVIKQIKKQYDEKIKIEEIQDLIEESLKKKGYDEVHNSFAQYRDRRNQSRDMFVDDKRMHKFLKTIEGLGVKSAS